jgi:hypothetical protein
MKRLTCQACWVGRVPIAKLALVGARRMELGEIAIVLGERLSEIFTIFPQNWPQSILCESSLRKLLINKVI